MEPEITESEPLVINKIYLHSQFFWATFLGGPVVGGYIIAHNYTVLGQPGNARITWAVTIPCSILIFSTAFMVADVPNFPNTAIPLIYTGIGGFIMQLLQGRQLDTYIANGGAAYNWKRTLVVSISGLLITLAAAFVIVFILALFFHVDFGKG